MKRIWAPWRKRYIFAKKRMSDCIFCRVRVAATKADRKNLLLYRSLHSFVMLNLYPYNNGHLMLVPNRHVPSLEKLEDEERLDILRLLDRSLGILRKSFHPQGFNIGMNLGKSGGAGVPDHVHIHVVPRWEGDTNFMPVIGGTKVISDSLNSTYEVLRRLLRR